MPESNLVSTITQVEPRTPHQTFFLPSQFSFRNRPMVRNTLFGPLLSDMLTVCLVCVVVSPMGARLPQRTLRLGGEVDGAWPVRRGACWASPALCATAPGIVTERLGRRCSHLDVLTIVAQVNKISAFNVKGFVINDQRLDGSIACVPRAVFGWKIKDFSDLTPESLEIFVGMNPSLGKWHTNMEWFQRE